MNDKIRIIIAVTIGTALATYLYNRKPSVPARSAIESAKVLSIGIVGGYAPYVSIDERGEYEGFDIDVAKAVAKYLGKELVLQDLGSMAPLFMALEQGSIDAIIWGLSITPERLNKVAMVKYAGDLVTEDALIFWGVVPEGIASVADMDGMAVCVEPGSSQAAVLSDYPAVVAVPIERIDDALLMLQYGKATAALVEPTIAAKFKKRYAEITSIPVPLPPNKQIHGVGIAIKKNNTLLIETITKAINALRALGYLAEAAGRWGIS